MAEKQPKKADDDIPAPRLHSFVEVIQGRYDGLVGAFEKLEGDRALIRARDHKREFPELVSVPLAHVKQSEHTGGR